MNKYAHINTENLPIVEVVFTGEQATDENFPMYMQEVKDVYEKQNKVVLIFDASNAVFPAIKYQKAQADWLKENEKLMKDYCLGTAYIIPNLIIRNVLKAIFTFQKQPVDYLVCKNIDDATNWVNDKIKTNI